LESKPGLFLE